MIKFIELTGEYNFKWEFSGVETERYGYYGNQTYENKYTRYYVVKLNGTELIEWLQTYGLTPDEMFKGQDTFNRWFKDTDTCMINNYDLKQKAEEWAENHKDIIAKNPWTVVGMNGGYVLLSDGSKENTVELGSASAPANVNINNSNTVRNVNKNDTNVAIVKNSLF